MKNQSGKTPLGWLLTIVVSLIIAGVAIAMIFGDSDKVRRFIKEYQNKNNTIQTDNQ